MSAWKTKKSVPSDIRKLHRLGWHCLPTRVGPVSAPPSEASAAAFDQAPAGTCPCPWRLPLLSPGEPSFFEVSRQRRFASISKRIATLEPHLRKQPLNTRLRYPRPKAPANPARLFGARPSSGRNRRGTRPPATGRLPFSRTGILEPDQLPATGAASGPTCVYPLGQENSTSFSDPRNQKFDRVYGPFSCGFRLHNPIHNRIFTFGPHSHKLSTPCPHALEIAPKSPP